MGEVESEHAKLLAALVQSPAKYHTVSGLRWDNTAGVVQSLSGQVWTLVNGTAAGSHAAVFRPATTTRRATRLRIDCERGQLLLQILGVTLRTLRLLLTQLNDFELVSTILTAVFKNRHNLSGQLDQEYDGYLWRLSNRWSRSSCDLTIPTS